MELSMDKILTSNEGRRFKILKREKDPRGSGFDLITCQFLDEPYDDNGNLVVVTRMASQVSRGILHNPYVRNVFDIGYSGEYQIYGDYDATVRDKWYSMLDRCRNDNHYENVTVDPNWHNFANFYKWITSQVGYKEYSLDKDFSQNGLVNKVYGPKTCIMIPQSLNVCIADKEDKFKIPTGISRLSNESKVEVTIPIMNEEGKTESVRLGKFLRTENGIAEAFIHSKIARELKLQTISQILYDNGYIDMAAYYNVSNYRYISKYTNMDRVDLILRPSSYKEDVDRFILTHNEFSVILNNMVERIKRIPLEFLTPLHKTKQNDDKK